MEVGWRLDLGQIIDYIETSRDISRTVKDGG